MGNKMGGQGALQEVLVHHEYTDRPGVYIVLSACH